MHKPTKLFLTYFAVLSLALMPLNAYALELTSALANDDSQGGAGVDSGDKLILTFDEDVENTEEVTETNLSDFFTLSPAHSFGTVSALAWSGGSGSGTLTVTFGSGTHTIVAGDTITPNDSGDGDDYLKDEGDTSITSTVEEIMGSFDREWDQFEDADIDSANDIFVDGSFAYVAAGSKGLYVVDIGTPEAMTEEGKLDYDGGEANGVFVDGDYAYVTDSNDGLVVIDISDPDDPDDTDAEDLDGDANDLYVDGTYAYIADGDNGLVIMEVDDDAIGDVVEDGFSDGFDGNVMDVFVADDYAYLAVDDTDNGLVVVDVSTPSSLAEAQVVGTMETNGEATGIYVDGDYAYLSLGEDGIQTFDISDPTDPSDVDDDESDLNDTYNAIYVSDDFAFLADGAEGLQVLAMDDGEIDDLEEEVTLPLAGEECQAITVDDSWAYLACGTEGVFSVNVDDISSGGSSSGSGDGPDYTEGDLYVYESYAGTGSDGSREKPYTSIQDAIDEADNGDEIVVFPGTYDEEITIDVDDLVLVGTGPSFVTITGSGDETVTIDAEGAEIRGFTISGGDTGIYLDSAADDIAIKNNIIIDTDTQAIHSDEADNVDIINNTIVKNNADGIVIDGSSVTVDVRNNLVYDNSGYGLDVESATNVTREYNFFGENDDNDVTGTTLGTTNITTGDPEFTDDDDDEFDWDDDADDEDFFLGSGSDAEDLGDDDSGYDDNDDSRNDMGAFGGPDAQYDDGDEPAEIDGLTAAVSAKTVTLDWDENEENDLFGYYIKRSATSTGTYTALNDLPVIGATYADTVSTNGKYYYKIIAVDLFEDEADLSDAVEANVSGGGTTSAFSDVPVGYEFYEYINALKLAGIINGFADGTFKPLRNVTRAEFLKMTLNAANLNSSAYATQGSCFSDMVDTHPLKQYVCYAKAMNFVSGSGGKFYPEREVSRFEAVKILLNVNGIPNITATTTTFADVILPEQIRYIAKAVELGLVSGYANGTFGPNNLMLRQEAAKVISKMRDHKGL